MPNTGRSTLATPNDSTGKTLSRRSRGYQITNLAIQGLSDLSGDIEWELPLAALDPPPGARLHVEPSCQLGAAKPCTHTRTFKIGR